MFNPARCKTLFTSVAMIFTVCKVALCADDQAIAQEHREMVAKTLRGIQEIHVVVEDIRPDAQSFGLNKEQIQNDIELKLRMSGIKIGNQPPAPILYVRVNTFYLTSEDIFAVAIECKVRESVVLARDPSILGIATTWEKSQSGAVRSVDLVSEVRGTVKDLVEIFINDFLSVNPRS